MSTGTKIPLAKALNYAERFLKFIEPHIVKAEIAGSIRRKQPMVGDIEIVVVENLEDPLSNLFQKGYPGMVKNGERYKQFKYPQVKIDLFIAKDYDYGRILAIRTGSSAFSHIKLAMTWNRLGYCGTDHGLRKKKDCTKKGNKWIIKPEVAGGEWKPPIFDTEESFFEFLKIDYIPPEQRNWVSKHEKINYSV